MRGIFEIEDITLPDYNALNAQIIISALLGLSALVVGISGTVPTKGAIKAAALLTSTAFLASASKDALVAAQSASIFEQQREITQNLLLQKGVIEAQAILDSHEVVAQETIIENLSQTLPTPIPVPQSPIPTPSQKTPQQKVDTPESKPPLPVTVHPVITKTRQSEIPDGAIAITPDALNDINRYPVVMVVAEQGSGKTVTVASIFEKLEGYKVLATPKIHDHRNAALAEVYDLKFGYDADREKGRYIGDTSNFDTLESHDLTWYLTAKPDGSHYLDFVAATFRESTNRQQYGMSADAQYWRIFGDEWSDIYTNGFLDPEKDKKEIIKAKGYMEQCIKSAFFNFRGQKVQMFVGCQSETVESIGASGISTARDIAWHLYPGKAAIEIAAKFGKNGLSRYLSEKVKAGYGVALLEKNGITFEVLELPSLEYLRKFDP
jgi:hypothetical protein